MPDLQGYTAISIVFLFTLIIASKWPKISNIIFTALILRIITMLIGHYFFVLPDSTADAITFERYAWDIAKNGFLNISDSYTGPSPKFLSWLIAIPYSLFGRSILMAKSITLFFGIGTVFLGWLLAKKVWDDHSANKVGWVIALFPSLILYSALVLREMYICFFLVVAFYGVVGWIRNNNLNSIILATTGFAIATFFHGAIFIGLIVFLIIVSSVLLIKILKSLLNNKISLKRFLILFLITISSGYYLSSKVKIPYLGTFASSIHIDTIIRRTDKATTGDASWPEWTKSKSIFEMVYKAPVRSIYFMFAPFPWDIKKISHMIGMLDGLIYIYLFYLIVLNIKNIWKDPILRTILIILLSYILIFGFGVGNFGTAIRHRVKFAVIIVLLAAPLIKKFIFLKKNIRSGN